MSEPKRDAAQIRFLLTNLAIVVIFILTLIVLLAAYPSLLAPAPTRTPTRTPRRTATSTVTLTPTVTATATITRTPRHTFTSTITPTPTRTATVTPTGIAMGPPTLTPARPVLGYENYKLNPWSAEQAAYLVDLINAYPNTLSRQARGVNDANYYAAFYYATIAQSEAILRYPDSPDVDRWSWQLAYNLARLQDPRAAQHYADLISRALNRLETTPVELGEWFQNKEALLSLEMKTIKGVPGALNTWLVEIGGPGSAFLILRETSGAYQASVLASLFDFSNPIEYKILSGDLTADGISEALFYPSRTGEYGAAWLPRIFDVSNDEPVELAFIPQKYAFQPGTESDNNWSIQAASDNTAQLVFTTLMFPACPLQVRKQYAWDGSWISPGGGEYQLKPNPGTLSYCNFVVEHAANVWGPESAAELMQSLLPVWPPEKDNDGNPYAAEAKDEWRFRLAVYHALAGNTQAATTTLNELLKNPLQPNGKWIKSAAQFQERFQNGAGLYLACVNAEYCDPRRALENNIATLPVDAYPNLLAKLKDAGVSIRSNGYFDFDGDGVKETWVTIRHHSGEKLELWILVPYPQGILPFIVTSIDTNVPALTYYQEEPLPPIVLVNNKSPFQITRMAESLRPYLIIPELPQTYPDRFKIKLQAARDALFNGTDPVKVQEQLLEIQKDPGLLCRGFWTCDEYYYLLGLASELAGDQADAIVAYLTVWWDNSRSPFTSMARLKLRGAAVQPSATITYTPTITGTPTAGPTFTSTITQTPDPNASPTTTATRTITPTPYPDPTETTIPTDVVYPTP